LRRSPALSCNEDVDAGSILDAEFEVDQRAVPV